MGATTSRAAATESGTIIAMKVPPILGTARRTNLTAAWFGVSTLVLAAAMLTAGCDTQRHLAGEGQSSGGSGEPSEPGTGGTRTTPGTGGTSSLGGTAGRDPGQGRGGGGTGGSSGTGGASLPAARPLSVSPLQAVTLASRLLWQTDPDQALVTMADSGALATTEDLHQLALRLQIDARAHNGVADFYRWWLDLGSISTVVKDTQVFGPVSDALLTAMASETETFATYVTLDGDGSFTTLLTAPFSFVNQSLAAIYGIGGISGSALRRVALDPTQRGGLFTQPGILAMTSTPTGTNPPHRGLYLYQRLLCQQIPSPPANVPPVAPLQGAMTTRQQFTVGVTQQVCAAACHTKFDPLGYAFEHFDGIGRYRTTENGAVVDASAMFTLGEQLIAFTDSRDLMAQLAHTPEAQTCMAEKWLQYAVGGRVLTDLEKTFVAEAQRSFAASGFNLRELIAAVIQSDLFLTHQETCVFGADQTCNENPSISSLHGHCTEARRCTCLPDWGLIPETGHCY